MRRTAARRPWRRRACRLLWVAALGLVAAGLWSQRASLHRLLAHRPDAIIIHHSATPPSVNGHVIDAAAIDAMHAARGFRKVYDGKVYHIGYHYVILQDGTVQPGRPEECPGAHARRENDHALGICLIGDYSSADNPRGRKGPTRPPAAQMRALLALCARLSRNYGIPAESVLCHRDVGQTACPGDRFPMESFRRDLRHEMEGSR